MDVRDRAVGSVLGLALGDALGAPFEFRRAVDVPDPLPAFELAWMGLPPGTTTDDTAMARNLIRSLVERGALDTSDVLARHVSWLATRPPDVGNLTRVVLSRAGRGAADAAREYVEQRGPEVSAGNGSVMYYTAAAPTMCWPSTSRRHEFAGRSTSSMGPAQGEQLAAVLGYRIERTLRERELGQYILGLHAVAPLTVDVDGTSDESTAAVAGSVADGERLVELLADGMLFGSDGQPFPGDDVNRTVVESVIADAADAVDALADVLLAESVHQLVRGDTAGASAALAAIDEGATPPQPDVTRTHHGGVGLTHRIAVILDRDRRTCPGWESSTARPRALAEPALDRWAGLLLGPPEQIRIDAVASDAAGNEVGWSFTLADVGIAAADVVGGIGRGTHGEASELEARLLRHAASLRPVAVAATAGTALRQTTGDGDALGLDGLLLVAEQIGHVVGSARPMSTTDLASPDDGPVSAGLDTTSMRQRAESTTATLRAAVDGLGATDRDELTGALGALADFASPIASSAPATRTRSCAAAPVHALAAAQARLDALDALVEPTAEVRPTTRPSPLLRQRIEMAFGGTLRVAGAVRGSPTAPS